MEIPKALAEAAVKLASDINAEGILISTESDFQQLLDLFDGEKHIPKIIVATTQETSQSVKNVGGVEILKVPAWKQGHNARVAQAVAHALKNNYVKKGQVLVCLVGDGVPGVANALICHEVTGEERALEEFLDPVLESTIELAIEIANTTLDGKQLGAAFVIGDAENILRFSTQLMINPYESHNANIQDRKEWELLKKYAAFDGAFVINTDGKIVAAHCKLEAERKVDIPRGLGTRHHAVAAMSLATNSVGVTVSQEDRKVRIFKKGKIIAQIDPRSRTTEWFKDSE
ncbi:MAG: diadenylate cyclase [Candidatus Hadarchaeales archaeon]